MSPIAAILAANGSDVAHDCLSSGKRIAYHSSVFSGQQLGCRFIIADLAADSSDVADLCCSRGQQLIRRYDSPNLRNLFKLMNADGIRA